MRAELGVFLHNLGDSTSGYLGTAINPQPPCLGAERHGGWSGQETLMEAEPIGDLLDSLGVIYHHEAGDLIASAVVLLKVIDTDGNVTLRTLCSDGISWIERIGMLRAAESVELPGAYESLGDEDE